MGYRLFAGRNNGSVLTGKVTVERRDAVGDEGKQWIDDGEAAW